MFKIIDKEFQKFFQDFFIPVCRFIQRYIGENESADIAQEVFVKVYEKWNEFETPENAKAFLYTIARNLCLNHLKHKKAREHYITGNQDKPDIVEQTFLKEVTREETFRVIHDAIGRLPGRTRQVILLSMEGHSNAEVGQILGISINSVKTLKKNAYTILRDLLSKEYLILLIILTRK